MPNILHAIFTFSFFYDKGDIIDSAPKVLNMHTLTVAAKNNFVQFTNTFLNLAIKTKGMKIEIILPVVFLKITLQILIINY